MSGYAVFMFAPYQLLLILSLPVATAHVRLSDSMILDLMCLS